MPFVLIRSTHRNLYNRARLQRNIWGKPHGIAINQDGS